jgi:hypothetical protein
MWPIQFAFRLRISCRIFLCSLTLSNTSSFLTWSVQLIFSVLLQDHISKLSRCFWSTARSVQVSAPFCVIWQNSKIFLRSWVTYFVHFPDFCEKHSHLTGMCVQIVCNNFAQINKEILKIGCRFRYTT